MTDVENEAKQQEMERDSLQRTISGLQGALMFSKAESRPVLEMALRNASGRLGGVEKRLKDLTVAREAEVREADTRAVLLAEKETQLNAEEKKTYAGFLKEDYFKKADFGRLEDFYKKSWDRLSESGKDEMSHRIWEGVRRDEYKFTELPSEVQEKEAKRAYGALTKQSNHANDVSKIPEEDRQEFIRAYEAGKHKEADKILERESFKNSMFLNRESAARVHTAVSRGHDTERADAAASVVDSKPSGALQKAPDVAKSGDKDLAAFQLDGVKLVEVEDHGSSAEIPNGRTRSTTGGKSTPGS